MRTATTLACTALLAACASVDPEKDRLEVAADVAARTNAEAAAQPRAELDPGTAPGVAALLAEPLTEEAAVRIALLNNHAVRAAYEHLGVARADLVQAGLLRNPVFDVDARFLFDGGTEIELGLAQPFLDLFYRPLRERLAEHEFNQARLRLTAGLVALVFDVRREFVDLHAARQVVELQQRALDAAEASHQLTLELHAAGNTTDQALAAERAAESRARVDLAAAELEALEAREPLNELMGLFGDATAWVETGRLADDVLAGLDTTRVEARAVAASLALQGQRERLDALAQHAQLASWRGWFPEAAAGISAVREPGGDWGVGPRLSGELPLLDAGSVRRSRAETDLRAALHAHVQGGVSVRSTARRLRDRTLQLAARARFLHDVHLPLRAEALRTTVQHYNAMQIGVFDVLRQKQQQLADGRDYVMTLRSAHRARLDLQELLAGGSPPAMPQPAASGHESTTTSGAETHR